MLMAPKDRMFAKDAAANGPVPKAAISPVLSYARHHPGGFSAGGSADDIGKGISFPQLSQDQVAAALPNFGQQSGGQKSPSHPMPTAKPYTPQQIAKANKEVPYGGYALGGMTPQHMAEGGLPSSSQMAPWYVRREANESEMGHPGGLLGGKTGGRTDVLPINTPAGSYVVPADVVSGLGEGNTNAGANVLDKMMHTLPYGIQGGGGKRGGMGIPRAPSAAKPPQGLNLNQINRGGAPKGTGNVPIIAASGEYIIPPHVVNALGNGNMKHGHRVLDSFVLKVRKKNIEDTKKLKPPKK